jgi:hypothetical protein
VQSCAQCLSKRYYDHPSVVHLWYTGINSDQQESRSPSDPQIQAKIVRNNEDPAIWRGLFLWNSVAFHLSRGLLTPHIKDKMTEIERNSPILRSDCLRKFRPFPINKNTSPPFENQGGSTKTPRTALEGIRGVFEIIP